MLQVRLEAGQEVVFRDQRNEVEPELERRGLDAGADIGDPAGDAGRDRDVRLFDRVLVSRHVVRLQPLLLAAGGP